MNTFNDLALRRGSTTLALLASCFFPSRDSLGSFERAETIPPAFSPPSLTTQSFSTIYRTQALEKKLAVVGGISHEVRILNDAVSKTVGERRGLNLSTAIAVQEHRATDFLNSIETTAVAQGLSTEEVQVAKAKAVLLKILSSSPMDGLSGKELETAQAKAKATYDVISGISIFDDRAAEWKGASDSQLVGTLVASGFTKGVRERVRNGVHDELKDGAKSSFAKLLEKLDIPGLSTIGCIGELYFQSGSWLTTLGVESSVAIGRLSLTDEKLDYKNSPEVREIIDDVLKKMDKENEELQKQRAICVELMEKDIRRYVESREQSKSNDLSQSSSPGPTSRERDRFRDFSHSRSSSQHDSAREAPVRERTQREAPQRDRPGRGERTNRSGEANGGSKDGKGTCKDAAGCLVG